MKTLITGANRGLGLSLTSLGLARGHEIFAACRPEANLKHLEALRQEYKDRLHLISLEVSSEESVRRAAKELEKKEPVLDCVINNAGILLESKYNLQDPIVNLDIEMFRRTLEVNTVGPAIVLKYFAPFLYGAAKPCILNITSEAGHLKTGLYTYLAYGVSKHGANMYTQKIRNYLAQSPEHARTRIFMIHPGRMNTEMGKENAQIEATEAAEGILKIMEGEINPKLEIPFINYKGEPMPY